MGIASDVGSMQQGGLAFGRQSFIGLGTNRWTLSLGRQYSPAEIAIISADALGQIYWGSTFSYAAVLTQSPASTAGQGCHGAGARVNNLVLGTATAGGFTGKLMVAAGEENQKGSGRLVNPAIHYESGPLVLVLVASYLQMRQCTADIPTLASPANQTETWSAVLVPSPGLRCFLVITSSTLPNQARY